jgi:uncharacterized protein (DUF58 family)
VLVFTICLSMLASFVGLFFFHSVLAWSMTQGLALLLSLLLPARSHEELSSPSEASIKAPATSNRFWSGLKSRLSIQSTASPAFQQNPTKILMIGWFSLQCWYGVLSGSHIAPSFFSEMTYWTILLFPVLPAIRNRRSIKALTVELKSIAPFHAGQPGNLKVNIHNRSPRPMGELSVGCDTSSTTTEIDGHQTTVVGVDLSDLPRGEHRLPPVRVTSTYPFGLLRSTQAISQPNLCLVYPKLEDNAPPWPENPIDVAATSRSGDEIVAVRDYIIGDPLSMVDWKLSAKRDQLVVREFAPPSAKHLQLSWDQVSHLPVEHALSRLASWVARAHRRGLSYSLALGQQVIPQGQGQSHCRTCLSSLAVYRQPVPGLP